MHQHTQHIDLPMFDDLKVDGIVILPFNSTISAQMKEVFYCYQEGNVRLPIDITTNPQLFEDKRNKNEIIVYKLDKANPIPHIVKYINIADPNDIITLSNQELGITCSKVSRNIFDYMIDSRRMLVIGNIVRKHVGICDELLKSIDEDDIFNTINTKTKHCRKDIPSHFKSEGKGCHSLKLYKESYIKQMKDKLSQADISPSNDSQVMIKSSLLDCINRVKSYRNYMKDIWDDISNMRRCKEEVDGFIKLAIKFVKDITDNEEEIKKHELYDYENDIPKFKKIYIIKNLHVGAYNKNKATGKTDVCVGYILAKSRHADGKWNIFFHSDTKCYNIISDILIGPEHMERYNKNMDVLYNKYESSKERKGVSQTANKKDKNKHNKIVRKIVKNMINDIIDKVVSSDLYDTNIGRWSHLTNMIEYE